MSADRERLKTIGRRIFDEFLRRVDDPKNVAKGDGWRDMSLDELYELHMEESGEFDEAVECGAGYPILEAADKLVVDAMRVDKFESIWKEIDERA